MFEDAQERLLRYILGILFLARDAAGDAEHATLEPANELRKCIEVAPAGAREQV
jgi:hypothetical protein